MGRALPVLVVIACLIYTIVYIVQSDSEQVRRLPKTVWLVVVLLIPVIGMILFWIFGRPTSRPPTPPLAPDDDPDFLRTI